MSEAFTILLVIFGGSGAIVLFVVAYLLLAPEKAELIFGWFAGVAATLFKKGHRTAIALRVQAAINSARAELLKGAPADILEGKLKIRWAQSADQAAALLRDGEILVVMDRSAHPEENIANALMAYLPKAMLPRARRYVDPERMRAADLIIAKAVLAQSGSPTGSLDVFFQDHLDPARAESDDLREKINELDAIDLEGWLVRVLLAEYKMLGDQLHPSEPDEGCRRDAEEFAKWLYGLASRKPGSTSTSLTYKGRYFRVAVIWVAIRERLAVQGLRPYRRRARRYLWRDQFDSVYLMARDDNISAVDELADEMETDVRVESVAKYRYALRADFRKRKLPRYRAIVVCLRRRRGPSEAPPEELDEVDARDDELPEEEYESLGEVPESTGTTEG